MMRYDEGESPDKAGTIKYGAFQLEGQQFAAMDSARVHDFTFNEAVSLIVRCKPKKKLIFIGKSFLQCLSQNNAVG